ncbi:MAG: SDR family NAD(P)-dependent oxidoreductase [Hyphomicrobiaceae bacterium]
MPRGLKDKTAIVTGGARGIGRGIATRLAENDVNVIIWDIEQSDTHASKVVDVTSLEAVETAFREALTLVGSVDILVNNAGINGPSLPTWSYPPDDWHRVINVDLTGVFHCCRTIATHMRDRGSGRIINIASIAGKEGNPLNSAYSAAKAGVIGLTKSLAQELAKDGVTVNAVAPAITETDLLREMTPDYIDGRRERIPMGRFCTVQEIADLVAWIASDECSFTTGFTFDVTGGRATY